MIDTQIRAVLDKPLIMIARWVMARGLRADHVTIIGFAIGIAAGIAIIFGAFILALCLILLSRLCDGLDGTIARLTKPTDRGAFLDISLDFLFYGFIPLSFAIYDEGNALVAACLLLSFIGTGGSFLSYAAIAEKRGISASVKGSKGLYYLGGLTEGTETILFLCACCLWPGYFKVLAAIFCGMCLVTSAVRLYRGYVDFE